MVRILLVEDDPAIGAVFSEALTNQRCIVNWVSDGQRGLDLATSVAYDLILLDRALPKLDGISFCRQLRTQGNHTPVLMMTASSENADVVTGLDAGADDYLLKPCSIPELLARVRALLRRSETVIPPLLRWEKLCLNPIAATVAYNKQLLTLTAKEYGLLELFLRHPQRIFSRTAILDRLWEFDALPNESVVTNHIKELRQKLKAAGMSIDPIETLYGLGYRLKPAPGQRTGDQEGEDRSIATEVGPRREATNTEGLEQQRGTSIAQGTMDQAESEARILVVDNDPTILTALDYLLTPWGIAVTGLSQPETFQQALIATEPDLLILDLDLPNSSGVDLCRLVRQDSRWSDLPILVVTTQTDTASIQRVFAAGADDFVGKPIVGPELVTRVISRLERVRMQHRAETPKQRSHTHLAKRTPARTELTSSDRLDSQANILLVDDQLDNLRTLAAILYGQGYKIRKAISGETALETIHSQVPDLVLLDIRMPNMNGYEVCAAMKAQEATREIPVIFLSALDDTADKLKAFAVGGADYITKPFQAEEVLTRIKHQLVIRQQQRQLVEQNQQLQREIQERQRSNAALYRTQTVLQESEERFRSAFDHASIGMALIGLDNCWLRVNPALCQMLGYCETELLSSAVSRILHPEDLDRQSDCVQFLLKQKQQSIQIELRLIKKTGHTIWVLLGISLVRNQNQPIYYVAQMQDITERKVIDQMKDEFISMVSHELRTPLTAIQGAIGLLASGTLDHQSEKTQRMLNIAVFESARLARLVGDVLDLERLNAGKIELIKEPCNVADLMQRSVESVQPIADLQSITLCLSPLSQEIWASSDAIIQTLTNLLGNAIKFSDAGSTVWLSAELVEGKREKGGEKEPVPSPSSSSSLATSAPPQSSTPHVRFAIRDQGCGIPADHLDSIFGRFQQVNVAESRRKGGTGLGLAICRSIVQQHGGQIWVESVLGEGSTFYFTLPI